jgi:mono/diheme cytochrome c family protein
MWGYRTGRAILLWLLLCSAFAMGEASAEPSPETIARGTALAVAGDCATCHTADPAKPFAGGKRIDTPFGGIYPPNLTPDSDTGLGPGAMTISTARCATAWPATARATTPLFPTPILQS